MLKVSLILIGIIVITLSSIFVGYSWASSSPPFSTQWGSYGLQNNGQFAFPQGSAVDSSGNIYVTDLGNRRVEKFDNTGTYLFTFGTKGSGNGQFQAPLGIAISGNSIYVVDNEKSNIQKFDTTGKFITEWGQQGSGDGQFLLPQGVAVDPSGDVYVVDTGNSRIEKFNSNGTYLFSFGQSGLEDGQFLSPRAIAADSQGSIYVSDSGNNRIEKFTEDGVFLKSFGTPTGSNLKTPLGLSVDKSGNIFVADNGDNRIVELDNNGNFITSWGSQGKGPDFFDNPRDVTVDSSGNVFVVDTENNRIQKFGSAPIQTQTQNPPTAQSNSQNQSIASSNPVATTPNPTQTNPIPITITAPNDKTPPSITAPADMTVEATGMLTPISIGQATATDDSGIASITNNAPQKFPVGITMITWSAIDNGGNTAKAIQKITVVDTTAPVLTAPQDVSVEAKILDHNTVDLGLPAVNDAVGVESVTNDAPPYFAIGQTTVTWKAIDISGNIATAKQIVNIKDTTAPVIHAPVDITQESTSPTSNVVNLGNATAIDNGVIKSVTNDAPSVFPFGKTTVTWTATDEAGNSASSTQLINIVDTTPPKVSPPTNIIFEATSIDQNVVPLGNATVTDNGIIKSITNNATQFFSLGRSTILWTAVDESGNKANATQIVDVVHTLPPKLIPPKAIEEQATSLTGNVIQLGNATATDIEPVTITNNASKTFPLGKTIVLWTAKDTSGNISNATQTVNVVNTIPPKLTPPPNITIEATSLNNTIAHLSVPTVKDLQQVTITNDAPKTFALGMTQVTWTAIDESGNRANVTQTVIIQDTTPPKINVPADVTIQATSSGNNQIQIGNATASDNVKVASLTNNASKTFPLGKTIVLWTAKDTSGNISNATQTVNVLDTTKPKIIVPRDITINATSSTNNKVDIGNATATDNTQVISIKNNAPAVFPFGNTTVTWTAIDEAGNTANSTQLVRVIDKSPPKLVIPQDVIINATAFETPVNLGQANATGIIDTQPKITSNSTGTFHIGKTIVEWNATDKFGNTRTLDQTVTILACGKPSSLYNVITGTSGNDILVGSMVPNLILGLGGNDIIHGGSAGDCIIAGDGDNVIYSGNGTSVIHAGNGDNIVRGENGNMLVYVGNGSNIIQGGTGQNTCYLGNPAKDTVVNCQAKLH